MGDAPGHPGDLRSVSDTALLVAYHRAMETGRPDALFRDPYAVRLSAGRGEAVAKRLRGGRRLAWSTVVRTVLIDEIVRRLVTEGADTVVNLAAGLDARPYRLALPPTLRWIEVDLPDVIRDKEALLASDKAACAVQRLAFDLSDPSRRREMFARLTEGSHHTVVVAEGLLAYLTPVVVGQLADDVRATPAVLDWVFDLATPAIARRMRRTLGRQLERAGAAYQFAPEEGTRFFTSHGWREAEFQELIEHARRLNRMMPGSWVLDVGRWIAPRRTARMLEKWRAGVVRLEPHGN